MRNGSAIALAAAQLTLRRRPAHALAALSRRPEVRIIRVPWLGAERPLSEDQEAR